MSKTIAVIFGGKSVEHEISILSAHSVMKWLNQSGFNVLPIYINKNGNWVVDDLLKNLETFKTPENLESSFTLRKFDNGEIVSKEGLFGNTKIKVDVIFPVMHGTNGEDGTIQSFAELLNIPYVGCDRKSSTIAMDKVLTNLVTEKYGIPHVRWTHFSLTDFENLKDRIISQIFKDMFDLDEQSENLSYSLIIKPANLGSSIGVSKANTKTELINALEVVSYLDKECIVERCVENLMEINCAIIGNENPIPSLLECPKKSGDLLNFNDKYLAGSMNGNAKMTEIPANLDETTTKEIQNMALNVYKSVGCSGISRVDMLYDMDEKKCYFNEINPMPGGLQAHLWRASGITSPDLVKKLVEYAEERFESNKKYTTNFTSNVLEASLSGAKGGKKMI